jgi:hypothetical protein
MGTGEADAGDAGGIVELDNKAIGVATNIENNAVVTHHIGSTIGRLDLRRLFPMRQLNFLFPSGNSAVERLALLWP